MKRSRLYLPLLFILSLLILPACVKQNAGSNTTANVKQPETGGPPKTTKAFPEMPAVVMTSQMKGLDGKNFTLKDHEGKVLLVNLWATWCGPCRFEMPELIKLQDEYRDKGLMVVGLDTDPEPLDFVKTFAERQKLNYTIGMLNDEAEDALIEISQMNGIPQSFLITPDGRLAKVFKGYNPRSTPQEVRKAIEDVFSRTSE